MMQSQADFEMPKAGVSYGRAYAVSLDANSMTVEASSLTWGETALTAMSRRVGFEVCTSTTIATPRAGARTTSQTTYVLLYRAERGFGWVVVAHPSVLLDLLRCHSISLSRRIPRHRLTHHPWWRRATIGLLHPTWTHISIVWR